MGSAKKSFDLKIVGFCYMTVWVWNVNWPDPLPKHRFNENNKIFPNNAWSTEISSSQEYINKWGFYFVSHVR